MGLYQESLRSYKEGLFGAIAVSVIAQACLGAVAAMYILQNGTSLMQMTQLLLVVTVCMAFNGAVLSNQKPKIIFNALIVSLAVSTVLALANMVM